MKRWVNHGISVAWSTLSAGVRIGVGAKLLKQHSLPARVVSIGNIQAGGAGKTPLVAEIARQAHARGQSVCILTRGYGGRWEHEGGLIAPKSADPSEVKKPRPEDTGDEAALLHALAPDAWLGVGSDRVAQFAKAQEMASRSFDLVLLDDGFQHWKIKRDLDLVVVTSSDPGQLPFRESWKSLSQADLVVWTKGDSEPPGWSKVHAPKIRVKFKVPAAQDSRPIWLVSGVGDPRETKKSVEAAGYPVYKHLVFPDHAHYEAETVRAIVEAARGASCRLAITGKDWVKWEGLGVSREAVLVLEPQVVFKEGREIWDKLLWD